MSMHAPWWREDEREKPKETERKNGGSFHSAPGGQHYDPDISQIPKTTFQDPPCCYAKWKREEIWSGSGTSLINTDKKKKDFCQGHCVVIVSLWPSACLPRQSPLCVSLCFSYCHPLYVRLFLPSVSSTSHRMCLHAQNHLPVSRPVIDRTKPFHLTLWLTSWSNVPEPQCERSTSQKQWLFNF